MPFLGYSTRAETRGVRRSRPTSSRTLPRRFRKRREERSAEGGTTLVLVLVLVLLHVLYLLAIAREIASGVLR